MRLLVVPKDNFSAQRWHELPGGFGVPHGNG